MTWPKSRAGSYLALVPSSTRMPQRTHRGWPEHYTIIYPWSEVRYHPTPRHMKLLSLGIPYVPYEPVHLKCLFNRAQLTQALIDTSGGLPPWSFEYQTRPLILLPIQYSPFSPNCPNPVSNYANHSIILLNHIGPPSIESALSWVDSSHSSSTDSLHY
jgi:hypothetical protein